MLKRIWIILFLAMAAHTILYAQAPQEEDTLVIETYYPSPYGYYDQLMVYSRMAIGDLTGDNNTTEDDLAGGADSTDFPGSLVVAGKVGIGTQGPVARLDVAGGIKIADDLDACDTSKSGTMRYRDAKVQYCNGESWLDVGGFKETAQGFRKSSGSRPIITVSAPAGTTPFVALNNVCAAKDSLSEHFCKHDGLKCNEAEGWKIAGAWDALNGNDGDIVPYPNGAITDDFMQDYETEVSILCIR